jgi:hypothetical protein
LFPELKVCVLVRRRFGALAVLSMALQWWKGWWSVFASCFLRSGDWPRRHRGSGWWVDLISSGPASRLFLCGILCDFVAVACYCESLLAVIELFLLTSFHSPLVVVWLSRLCWWFYFVFGSA